MGTDTVKEDLRLFHGQIKDVRADLAELYNVQSDEWRASAQGAAASYAIDRLDAALTVLGSA